MKIQKPASPATDPLASPFENIDADQLDIITGGCACGCGQANCGQGVPTATTTTTNPYQFQHRWGR
jgi:hypothetical protein